MDLALFHLIEEFIIKECDSRDIEYTPTASRVMRRNLNKVLIQLRESEYEKNNFDENLNDNNTETDKDVKKRKRSDTNLVTESENETESEQESHSEEIDRDYDDSEHKYHYHESIILPYNIKYCLAIIYISIIFSVYSSMFYLVTTYSVYSGERDSYVDLYSENELNCSKSYL